MRRFIVETVVDAVVILVIILFLGLFKVAQPFPFGLESAPILQLKGAGIIPFLVTAAILVLSQRFVRPVIVAFTGRLLLSTMGLFLVIVNALVIWVATLVAPDIATVAQPSTLWLLVFAALYTILGGGRGCRAGPQQPEAGAGERVRQDLAGPRVAAHPEPQLHPREPAPAAGLRPGLRGGPRPDAARHARSAGSAAGSRARSSASRTSSRPGRGPSASAILLQQLGPTYVKIGQMIASRGDVLPPDLIAELSKLQSDAAPFPWEEAQPGDPGGAGQAPGGALRLDRPRAVRGGVHGPGAPRHPPRRHRRGREGPAAADRRQDEGGPGRDHPARRHRRAPRGHGAQGGRCRDGPRVRRRRPQGAGLPQRGVPREAPGGQHGAASPRSPCPGSTTTCRAPASSPWSSSPGSRSPRWMRSARPGSTPTRWAPCSSARSSSRSSSTASSTATRTPGTCWRTPRTSAWSSWTWAWSAS